MPRGDTPAYLCSMAHHASETCSAVPLQPIYPPSRYTLPLDLFTPSGNMLNDVGLSFKDQLGGVKTFFADQRKVCPSRTNNLTLILPLPRSTSTSPDTAPQELLSTVHAQQAHSYTAAATFQHPPSLSPAAPLQPFNSYDDLLPFLSFSYSLL